MLSLLRDMYRQRKSLRPQMYRTFSKSAMDGYAIAFSTDCNEYIVDGVIGAGVV